LLQRFCRIEILRNVGAKGFRFSDWEPIMPFKLDSKGRSHIPRQRHRGTNWRGYDASLRNRGSLTAWVTPDAICGNEGVAPNNAGRSAPLSGPGHRNPVALRTVLRLALRQCERSIGSLMKMLKISLQVPDYTTLNRRAGGLPVQMPRKDQISDLHLIGDSTGLRPWGFIC
jgi:hypothetical protein